MARSNAVTASKKNTEMRPGRTERKRQAILQEAETLFLDRGFDGASVEEVAARAAVSKQTVYKQFENKAALFVAVVQAMTSHGSDRVQVEMRNPKTAAGVSDVLMGHGERLLTVALAPKLLRLRRLVIAETDRFPELGHALYEGGTWSRHRRPRGGAATLDRPWVSDHGRTDGCRNAIQLARHGRPDQPCDVLRRRDPLAERKTAALDPQRSRLSCRIRAPGCVRLKTPGVGWQASRPRRTLQATSGITMPRSTHKNLQVLTFAIAQNLEAHMSSEARTSKGFWLKLSKRGASETTISKNDAIAAAICCGWIDGQLDIFDEHYFLVRMTPRRPDSRWSAKNRATAEQLAKQGRIRPAGVAEIQAARNDGRWDAAYLSQSKMELPKDLEAALESDKAAKTFFDGLDRANRYAIIYRVNDAKRPETRARRIADFVKMLARGETIHPCRASRKAANKPTP